MEHIDTIEQIAEVSRLVEIAAQELEDRTNELYDLYIKLRDAGVPLIVLGNIMGVTRQRAKQRLDAYELRKSRSKPDES